MAAPSFSGFPRATIRFLRNLEAHNEKRWFDVHRAEYEADYLAPAVAFVEALGAELRAHFPALHVDPRTNGSGSLMRIYRDTRFSQDKTPYKTSISALFWEGDSRKAECPAFGFQLTPDGLGLMAGLFGFTKGQLARYQQAVLDEETGPALVRAAGDVQAAGPFVLDGQGYKKVPRGFDPAHPRSEWLLYKGLWAHTRDSLPLDQVHAPDLISRCLDSCLKMAPIQRWLVGILG